MQMRTSQVWSVRMTLPPVPNSADRFRRYVQNKNVTCFCETLEGALKLVREAFPDATLYSVTHRGKDDMYWDGDVTRPAEALVSAPSECEGESK